MTELGTGFPLPLGQLPAGERDRFRQVCGLLARPRLEPAHAEAVHARLHAADWQPLPRLSATFALEPLLVHNAIQSGADGARLFGDSPAAPCLPRASYRSLATNYYLRRKALTDLFEAMAAAGIARLLLIKGAALAPLYPSPALRDMEDVDLVVEASDLPRAAEALRAQGWTHRPSSWAHPGGCLLDLQRADSLRGGGAILDRAQPHPTFGARLPVLLPRPADHLVLLALHAARHRGLRIWREMCDAQLLLDNGRRAGVAREALDIATACGAAPASAALLRLLNRWSCPVDALPDSPADGWNDALEEACNLHLAVYEQLMVDRISEFGFISVANLVLPFPRLVRASGRALRGIVSAGRRRTNAAAGVSQRDPQFGDLPPLDSFQRQWIKMRVLLHTIRRGQFRHYLRLLRQSDRIASVARKTTPAAGAVGWGDHG